MKRLLLISLLSLGCLSNLEATTYSYDSYVAAVDKGSFDPYGIVNVSGDQVGFQGLINTTGNALVTAGEVTGSGDGLWFVIQNEGPNSPRALKIKEARKRTPNPYS